MQKTVAEVPRHAFQALCRKRNTEVRARIGLFRSHVRRLFTELLNLSFGHEAVYRIVGWLNSRFGLVASVFLAYPANDEYSDAYAYRFRAKTMVWAPKPIGFFWQDGKIGVKFAISARDRQFIDPGNKEKVRGVVERMEKIRILLGARYKTFAGILPGVIFRSRMIREAPEAEMTASVVVRAIEMVRTGEGLPAETPIIILGSRGFIGRKVIAGLSGKNVHGVDVADQTGNSSWPERLKGIPAILVNISSSSALSQYVGRMWSGIVVVNEVYPEPSADLASGIMAAGCRCYHIVGVKAGAVPSFPGGYEGGIPCCAAWPSEDFSPQIKRIV
jgi:hypothetical protein